MLANCESILRIFFRHLDRFEYDALLELCTQDVTWLRRGESLDGHAGIRAMLDARSRTQRIRHVLNHCVITAQASDECEIAGYLLVFRHDDGHPCEGVAHIAGPSQFLGVNARVRLNDPHARIAALSTEAEFQFAAPALQTRT